MTDTDLDFISNETLNFIVDPELGIVPKSKNDMTVGDYQFLHFKNCKLVFSSKMSFNDCVFENSEIVGQTTGVKFKNCRFIKLKVSDMSGCQFVGSSIVGCNIDSSKNVFKKTVVEP